MVLGLRVLNCACWEEGCVVHHQGDSLQPGLVWGPRSKCLKHSSGLEGRVRAIVQVEGPQWRGEQTVREVWLPRRAGQVTDVTGKILGYESEQSPASGRSHSWGGRCGFPGISYSSCCTQFRCRLCCEAFYRRATPQPMSRVCARAPLFTLTPIMGSGVSAALRASPAPALPWGLHSACTPSLHPSRLSSAAASL